MAAVVVARRRVVRAGMVRCMVNVLRKLGFGGVLQEIDGLKVPW